MKSCGQFFHTRCLDLLPRVKWQSVPEGDMSNAVTVTPARQAFTCPTHLCTGCHMSGDSLRMINCWHCIDAYHTCCMPTDVIKLNEKNCKCDECIRFDASLGSAFIGSKAIASSSAQLMLSNPRASPAGKRPVIYIRDSDSDSEMDQAETGGTHAGAAESWRMGATSSSGLNGASSSRMMPFEEASTSSAALVMMPPT
eukprot:1015380-Pyramimonas_sp.AAC.1